MDQIDPPLCPPPLSDWHHVSGPLSHPLYNKILLQHFLTHRPLFVVKIFLILFFFSSVTRYLIDIKVYCTKNCSQYHTILTSCYIWELITSFCLYWGSKYGVLCETSLPLSSFWRNLFSSLSRLFFSSKEHQLVCNIVGNWGTLTWKLKKVWGIGINHTKHNVITYYSSLEKKILHTGDTNSWCVQIIANGP